MKIFPAFPITAKLARHKPVLRVYFNFWVSGLQVTSWLLFRRQLKMLGVMVDTAERGVAKIDNKGSRKQDLVAELQKILQCGVPTNYGPF